MLTGKPLTPINVFMLLSFLYVLRKDTCYIIGHALLQSYDAYVSLGRIEKFLLIENLPAIARGQSREGTLRTDRNSTQVTPSGPSDNQKNMKDVFSVDDIKFRDKPGTLRVSNLTYKEIDREGKHILRSIEFSTVARSLTVITGPVGSGKSTLLSAIAGEVSDISGSILFKGALVYVPQTAWVFCGTIRENILFGQPYDESKYTRVIDACALTEDIQRFPDYDETIVGEYGEVLSGGQRARVSLARAVYVDADLYLLDDPLSAVDVKVGQHIFDKCVKNLLGNKTRVLTSHQEQHMKEADEVIVLHKGCVLEKGSFSELQGKGVLSATVDPLYKAALNDNKSNESFLWGDEEKGEDIDSCGEALPSEARGLQISEEDRTIGVVSSVLYWNYFRSGVPTLMIVAAIILCFITQGKT